VFKAASKAALWTHNKFSTVAKDLEKAQGAGDLVATGTKATRLDIAAEWFAKRVLGRESCGCSMRRSICNSLWPYTLPKLVIAIPEFNDRAGLWAMLYHLRDEIKLAWIEDHVEILIVTQTPTIKAPLRQIKDFGTDKQEELQPLPASDIAGPEPLQHLCASITASGVKCHYREYTGVIGTSPAKRACVDYAKQLGGEWLWICDSHLHFSRGSVGRFWDWMSKTKNRNSKHLYHCPLLFDDTKSAFTHMQTRNDKRLALVGGDHLWGQFRTEIELLKDDSEMKEIEAHGGFWMASRVDIAFQTFGHRLFKGFSDPETILQEQRRAAGYKVFCLPSRMVSCEHRFLKVRHNDYHSTWKDALRNHVIGVQSLRVHLMREAVAAGFDEPAGWIIASWIDAFPDRAQEIQQVAMVAIDEFRKWDAEQKNARREMAEKQRDQQLKDHAKREEVRLRREQLQSEIQALEHPQTTAKKPPVTDTDKTFDEIHAKRLWGDGETVSGPGSTLDATAKLRVELSKMVARLKIKSLLDIPCGDANWMTKTEWITNVKYIGADVVAAIVDQNRKAYPKLRFELLDIRKDELPAVDAVFVRDCLVHLPYNEIMEAIENVKRSGATWLMATHFPGRTNHDIQAGHWRPLDMTAEPFLLPEPAAIINEGCKEGDGAFADKSIGVWRVADLVGCEAKQTEEVVA